MTVRLGRPIVLAEPDDLSAEAKLAAEWWRRYAPPRYRKLLDAQPDYGRRKMAIAALAFLWLEREARYRRPNGSYVPTAQVRAALDQALQRSGQAMLSATAQLRTGNLTLADWQRTMAAEIRAAHVAAAAAAKGGMAQLTGADYGRIAERLSQQQGYLANFAQQVADGAQKLDGTLGRRAKMYAEAGRGTYHDFRQSEMAKRGYDLERNVLESAHPCTQCPKESALGWVPVGTLTPIGERICRVNCKCRIEYRNSMTGEAAE